MKLPYYETAKSTWEDLILYHEGPSDVKENRVMDLKLCYNTFKFKKGENLTQTFTRYKALMNKLVNDGIKLSKLGINTGFINGLLKKWLSFCQSLKNTNHVKDSELASLFGKLKYKENLIDDSFNDEEYTRRSQEYMNDLEMKFHERALLAKSKRFFKWAPFQNNPQPKFISSFHQHKPGLRPTKDFEAKYNKVKAKLAFLSVGTSASKSSQVKNQGLIVEAYEWDEEEVSSDDNKTVEVKVLMALADDESGNVGKESARNSEWIKIFIRKCINEQIPNQKRKILGVDQLTEDPSSSGKKDLVLVKSLGDDTNMSIPNVERPWLSETEGFNFPNRDTFRILPSESQVKSDIENPNWYWIVDAQGICGTTRP
ncbi:hypothetical protein Tco_1086765 [Tanacetum coccineum]